MKRKREGWLLSVLLLLFAGCRVEYSPYEVTVAATEINRKSAAAIEAKALAYPYSIAIFSDTHIYYANYERVAHAVAKGGHAFAIHAGDMTDTGLQREFELNRKFSKKTGIPVLYGIGNHDALSNGIFVYRRMYGPLNYTVTAGLNRYIFWNNNSWEFGSDGPDWEWLESALSKAYEAVASTGGQIVVVNHAAFNDAERFGPLERERYLELMTSYGVSLSLNGHDHNPVHDVDRDGVDYLTVGSVQKRVYLKITFTGPGRRDFMVEWIDV